MYDILEDIKDDYSELLVDVIVQSLEQYFNYGSESFTIDDFDVSISITKLDALNKIIDVSIYNELEDYDFEVRFESGINVGLELVDYGSSLERFKKWVTIKYVDFNERSAATFAQAKFLKKLGEHSVDDLSDYDLERLDKFIENSINSSRTLFNRYANEMDELLRKESYDNYVTGVSNSSHYNDKWEKFNGIHYSIESKQVLSD